MKSQRETRRNLPAGKERLEARVSSEQKRFFQRAAELRGVTLTDFMIGTLQEASARTVEEHSVLRLAAEDRRAFVDALLNPPAPNRALRTAAQRYRRMVAR